MNIGTLTIEIAANIARLQRDMDESKRVVSTAMKDIEGFVNLAKTAFIGLTGIAGVNAFVGMVNGAIAAKKGLYDLSLQTGISVEALSAMGRIAKYSDTNLTDVAAASNKLSKALFTQNEDSKGAAQAMKALGLDFDAFKRLQPDQQMLAVARSMDRFEDGTGKAAAAQLLFGKAGAQLLPFLKEMADKTELVGKETTESAKQAKQYEDNLKKLKAAGDEWKRVLVNEMLPPLTDFTTALVRAQKEHTIWTTLLGRASGNAKNYLGISDSDQQAKQLRDLATAQRFAMKEFQLASAELEASPGSAGLQKKVADARSRLTGIFEQSMALSDAMKGAVATQPLFNDRRFSGEVKGALALKDTDADGRVQKIADAYPALIARMKEKQELETLEDQLSRRLTSGEKEALDVMVKVRDNQIKLTGGRAQEVSKVLETMLATEKLNKQREEEVKWLEETRRENAALVESEMRRVHQLVEETAAIQRQVEEYGLTAEQLEALTSARLRDTAAALLQKRGVEDFNPTQAAMNRLLEQQAQALLDNAAARDVLAAKIARDHNDPYAGADRAVREYMQDVERAGDSTAVAVRNAIGGIENFGTSLLTTGHGDIKAWVTMVISEVNRLYVVRPLLASIFGGSGGMGGSGFGGTSGGGLIGSLMGALRFGGSSNNPSAANYENSFDLMNGAGGSGGGFLGSIASLFSGFFAGGGYIPPGQWGIAGERGPEPVFGGRTGATVQASGQGGSAPQKVVHVGGIYVSVPQGTSRESATQTAAATGQAVQRALARFT